MRRTFMAVLAIAALWAVTLVAFLLFTNTAPRPDIWIALIAGLWLIALVIYAALLNPEGQFSRYLIVGLITLVAAAIVVSRLMTMFFGRSVPST
jgi:hypothetical protein